jgi:protease-4
MARSALAALAALAACSSSSSSALDHVSESTADPWLASSHARKDGERKRDGDKDGELGGLDVQKILQRIKESVEEPGPYEAPPKSKDFDDQKPHWGALSLHGAIVEREAFSFTGGRGTELAQLRDRLRALAKNDKLVGIVLRVGELEVSVPDAIELRAALHELRDAGKKLRCHAERADNATYMVLAACDTIGLAPLGELAIAGPAAMPIHVKPLLDKLGIQADFLHVGAYKGAAEPLTRDAPSKEMEETLGAILDQRYQTLVTSIATDRKLAPDVVKALIDNALFPAEHAKSAKLVDEIATYEQFRDVPGLPWTKLDIAPDRKDQLSMWLKVARFLGAMPQEKPLVDHVAVVYAVGNIVDGDDQGVLGARSEIAAHTLVAALRAIEADTAVKAVVLRIDSGGGSAQASELIWRAVADVVAKKPVVVSMSDVAASGGYYIASGATKIYALEDTLTGSIGVVGGRLALAGALAKLGVNTFPMGRGKHATLFASPRPWTDDEKKLIENTMKDVYTTFVGRVAAGRHKTPAEIEPIAQGRVWTGAKAKQLGLVDDIGGLDAAIAEARKLGKVEATDVEVYPPAPSLRDLLVGFGQVHAPVISGLDAETAAALDPALARAAERLVELALSFRSTPVQAIAIVPVVR